MTKLLRIRAESESSLVRGGMVFGVAAVYMAALTLSLSLELSLSLSLELSSSLEPPAAATVPVESLHLLK